MRGEDDYFGWMRSVRQGLTVIWSDLILVAERTEALTNEARAAGTPKLARDAEAIGQEVRRVVSAVWDLTLVVSRELRQRQDDATGPHRKVDRADE